jgi:hypothetical protein
MRSPLVERRGPPRARGEPPISQKSTRGTADIVQTGAGAQAPRRPTLKLRFPPSTEATAAIEAARFAVKPSPPPSPPAAEKQRVDSKISAQAQAYRIINCLVDLRERFPGPFRPPDDPGPWPPLARFIHKAIREREPGLSSTLLRHAINQYTRDWRYRAGHVEGAMRVDIDGRPAGAITPEEQARYMEGGARS